MCIFQVKNFAKSEKQEEKFGMWKNVLLLHGKYR